MIKVLKILALKDGKMKCILSEYECEGIKLMTAEEFKLFRRNMRTELNVPQLFINYSEK